MNPRPFVERILPVFGVLFALSQTLGCKVTLLRDESLSSATTEASPSPSASASTAASSSATTNNSLASLSVTAVSPSSGATGGGTSVTITGTGFDATTTASFGGSSCNSVTLLSSTQIKCTTSAHAAGAVAVVLSRSDSSTATLAGGFTYQGGTWTWLGGYAQLRSWITAGTFGASTADGGLNFSYGLAVGSGTLLVSDSSNFRLSKYNLSTGALVGSVGKSIASGTCTSGTQASWCTGGVFSTGTAPGAFGFAKGVAIDASGNFAYVVDTTNQSVLKFNLSTGAFVGAIGYSNSASGNCALGVQTAGWCTGTTTFAGTTAEAAFSTPVSIAIDPSGFIYVSDWHRVQKFNASTGIFVGAIGRGNGAGTCAVGVQTSWCSGGSFSSGASDGHFNTPVGIAIDGNGSFIYVADSVNNHRVQKFNLATGGYVGSIGNSTATGTCVAGGQNAWCTGGTFSSGAGNGMMNTPVALAIDSPTGFLFVGDSANYRVLKFNLSSGAFVGAIGKSTAAGTCTAGAQSTWCTGGTFSTGGTDGMFPATLNSLAADANYVYAMDASYARVQRFNASTGAFAGGLGASSTENITGATLVLTGWDAPTPMAVAAAAAADRAFNYTYGGTVDASGYLYVADYFNRRIQKFNLSTGAFIGAVGNSTASGTCSAGGQPSWCTGGTFSSSGADGGFSLVHRISFGGGFLFASDIGSNRVQKFNATTGAAVGSIGRANGGGTCANGPQTAWCTGGTIWFNSSGDGEFDAPRGSVVHPSGSYLYVADQNNHRIQRFNAATGAFAGSIGKSTASGTCAAGAQTSWCTGGVFSSGTSDGHLSSPSSVTIDSSGSVLYVSETLGHRIQKFNATTGVFIGSIGKSTAAGTCIAGGQNAWCTGGSFSNGSGDGMMDSPVSVSLDAANAFLYVSDYTNNRVLKFNASTGGFVGAMGYLATAAGTCVQGVQTTWCTGAGVFNTGKLPGAFTEIWGSFIDPTSGALYIADGTGHRIQRFSAP